MMTAGDTARTRQGGVCRQLMNDPKALKAMQALRAEHLKDMQAWNDKYGADPTSAAAQKALRELRQEHWNDMRQLLKKYGITLPDRGPGMMGGGWNGRQGGAWGGCRGSRPTPAQSASPGSYGPGMTGSGAGSGMMGYGASL